MTPPPVISDLDIWRAAQVLVTSHGEDAAAHALRRAEALAAQGDADGAVVWRRILHAVEDLQSTEPAPGTRIN